MWLQAPQLFSSSCRFRQTPPQSLNGELHALTHTPDSQAWSRPQVWPHEPQLRISVAKLTQPPLQAMRPLGQEAAHTLFAHSGVAPLQIVPQFPQLAGSSLVLVQVAPQMSPCTQPFGTTQKLMPVTQTWAAGQDWVEEHGCSPPGPELLPQADARVSASTAIMGLVGERMDSMLGHSSGPTQSKASHVERYSGRHIRTVAQDRLHAGTRPHTGCGALAAQARSARTRRPT